MLSLVLRELLLNCYKNIEISETKFGARRWGEKRERERERGNIATTSRKGLWNSEVSNEDTDNEVKAWGRAGAGWRRAKGGTIRGDIHNTLNNKEKKCCREVHKSSSVLH